VLASWLSIAIGPEPKKSIFSVASG